MQKVSLPYIDNAKAVLLTVAINVGVVFAFFWPDGARFYDALWDSLICAGTTVLINLWIVYACMRKMRAGGQMPSQVPVSRFMQRLPRNPFALGIIYAVVFGALTVGINAAILWFFDMRSMAFVPWMVYKLAYTTILSVKITEYCIFRYVQPDWAGAECTDNETQTPRKPVKDPLPKIGVFKAMYGSVTGNIALSMIIGLALGGVVIAPDGSAVVPPTTVDGIPITGLIFGLILGILLTGGVVKGVNASILASGATIPEEMISDRRFAWMPKRKGPLTVFVCIFMMIFSAIALWCLMTLLEIPVMNAYQFAVFITAYASVVGKPLSYVLVRRCTQPDYVRFSLSTKSPS